MVILKKGDQKMNEILKEELGKIKKLIYEDGCRIWINDKILKNLVIEECTDEDSESNDNLEGLA